MSEEQKIDVVEQKIDVVTTQVTWPRATVERLLSRFPRLTEQQAIAAIRAADAYGGARGHDVAWVYAFQLAAFVSDPK